MTHISCCNEETAERFAMNRLSASALEAFEEHLLICSPCVDRVEGIHEYIDAFRATRAGVSL